MYILYVVNIRACFSAVLAEKCPQQKYVLKKDACIIEAMMLCAVASIIYTHAVPKNCLCMSGENIF